MRTRLVVLLTVAAAMAIAVPAGVGAQASKRVYINIAGFGAPVRLAYKPRAMREITGDGTAFLDHITWHRWNSPVATATAHLHTDDCVPDCAEGHFTSHPTRLRAFRRRPCATAGRTMYTRLRIRGARIGGSTVLSLSGEGCGQ